MNAVHDPDRRIAAFFEEGIEILPDWVLDAVRDEIDTTQQRRGWRPAWRMPTMSYGLRLGLVLTLVFLGLGLALITRPSIGSPPRTQPSPATWSGSVRADASGMPVLPLTQDAGGVEWTWADGRDTAVPWVDISAVRLSPEHADQWWIELADWPPRAEGLDPDRTIIEYGVVLDTNRDRVADFEFGINNDAPEAGEFRVWVTDLAAGDTNERVGPPYGYPVEFSYPERQRDPTGNGPLSQPSVIFTFLPGSMPMGTRDEVFHSDQWQFYVWATVTEGDEVVAWDYGPDSGWLAMTPP
jgi:hypothetical protein